MNEPNEPKYTDEDSLRKAFNEKVCSIYCELQTFRQLTQLVSQIPAIKRTDTENAIADILAHTDEVIVALVQQLIKNVAVLRLTLPPPPSLN